MFDFFNILSTNPILVFDVVIMPSLALPRYAKSAIANDFEFSHYDAKAFYHKSFTYRLHYVLIAINLDVV